MRTQFRTLSLAALALLILASCGPAPSPAKPNILFIAVDDMNDWAGCLRGHPQALTPNIDRLASQGVLFTNAHCANPLCTPSRTAILTGRAAYRTRVYSNGDQFEDFEKNLTNLPAHFRANGYRTLTAGKVFPGGEYATAAWDVNGPGSGPAQGGPFTKEEYERTGKPPRYLVERLGVTRPLSGMIDRRGNGTGGGSFDWGPFDLPDNAFGDGRVADWAVEQLRSPVDQPFFMAVGFYRPHQPLYAPRKYFEPFPPEETKLPETRDDDLDDLSESARLRAVVAATSGAHEWVLEAGKWNEAVAAYLACIHFADAQVGRVLDALEEGGKADDTIIVLWSDHGWHLGEKQHWGKFTGWEEATRVPMVIALPPSMKDGELGSALAPGREFESAVSLLDLYPTLIDMAGLPPVDDLDGRSLIPELQGRTPSEEPAVVVNFGRGNFTVVSGEWRYVHYFDGAEELYNIAGDPNEFTNLAGDPAGREQLDRLRRHLPDVPYIEWTARYRQYKMVSYTGGGVRLLDLTERNNATDRGNIADEHPEIVKLMQSYVSRNDIGERHFVVPDAYR